MTRFRCCKVASFRPSVEMLEDRNLLSTYAVDHLADDMVGDGLNGSLRYCITKAIDGDDINFGVTGTINLGAALPDLTHSISIQGPGANTLTVRGGGGLYKIFSVSTSATVSISGLTVANGGSGGIANWEGTLTVSNSTISGNHNSNGIVNSGTMTVTNSTISGNFDGIANGGTMTVTNSTISDNNRGGIGNGGTMTVTDSTISGNDVDGGIANGGTLTVSNSTISGNRYYGGGFSPPGGGGIQNYGTLTISFSTIAGNYSTYEGGGIYNGSYPGYEATLTLSNSIVSANSTGISESEYDEYTFGSSAAMS